MKKKYILAIDQGTTSSRAIVFDTGGNIVGKAGREFRQIYPRPGWVEHDAGEIWTVQREAIIEAVKRADINPSEIISLGITNQRETVVLWNKETGKPVYNAIVWQCRRTSDECEKLRADGLENDIWLRTGLKVDAYFSGTKIKWILDNIPGVREESKKGNICAGTIDSWLVWNLTCGKSHVTDVSNASRTMLFNINTLEWDCGLLKTLGIPIEILPRVKPSSSIHGYTDNGILGCEIPIASILGDQQASLFGQACFEIGTAKNTYGTGCFMLMNTGPKPVFSKNGLLTTIAWGAGGEVVYALEGSTFIAGAAIQWLRDELKLIQSARQCDELAEKVDGTNGVYFVPAFAGLGTPYWDMYARGAILGLTRGTRVEHIARAVLEAIAYQVKDVLNCMQEDAFHSLKTLKVDGGASASNILMQFQSDILRVNVYRPRIIETTALGAALMAGLTTGVWASNDEIARVWSGDRIFVPNMSEESCDKLYSGWKKAVSRAMNWEDK